MLGKNNVLNPFISGRPVYGDHFFGRKYYLQKALEQPELKLLLFLSTRRMGKTSLCFQIRHLCEKEVDYQSNVCVVWDLQGKQNIAEAKRGLLSRENRNTLELEDVGWKQLERINTCAELLEAFCKPYWKSAFKKTIMLMIDEPEALLTFAQQGENEFFTNLKDAFEQLPNLRVMIVGPPNVQDLFSFNQVPCLLEQFQIEYLREFERQEAEELIRLSKRTEAVLDDIIKVSNRVPFYIQGICHEIVNAPANKDPLQVIHEITERQTFAPFFRSDFDVLHPIQKIMLLILVRSQKPQGGPFLVAETKRVVRDVKGQIPTLKYVSELFALSILKKMTDGKYEIANPLFRDWISHDFENLSLRTMRLINLEIKQVSQANQNQPVDSLKRGDLPSHLRGKICKFLVNNSFFVHSSGRKAFIYKVGGLEPLLDLIDVGGTTEEFVPLLVTTLARYGTFDNGRNALEAVLLVARGMVGLEGQNACDEILDELHGLAPAK